MANTLLLHIGAILCCIAAVVALKCYTCSSILEPKCGTTWGFEGTAGDVYLEDCPATSKSCDKIVGDIQGSGDQYVYRNCFNDSTTAPAPANECSDEDVRGEIYCHCNVDGCNGVTHHIGITWILTFVFAFLYRSL